MRVAGRSEVLRDATGALVAGRSVLLHGPSGIGKSVVAGAVAAHLAASGVTVLRTTPAEVEASLPHVVLVDLFADQLSRVRGLPTHLREALEVALLRAPAQATPRDALTIRIAVLELLRRLAGDGPVTMLIDDAQWVDEASAEVLAFAARRLGDARVTVLATERVSDGEPLTRQLCPGDTRVIAVEPLGYRGIATVLAGQGLSPSIVRRIHKASGGNPLVAVELGNALSRRDETLEDHDPLPVPGRLRSLLSDHLTGLSESTRETLLLAAAVARPSLGMLGLPVDAFDEAEQAQVIAVNGDGSVVFRHPLLRELVYADATAAQRRTAHALLMSIVEDPVERVLHLALGSAGPDEGTAALADAAAADAAARGAFASAAALSRLAAQRTPIPAGDAAARRLLAAARYADAAGQVARAREAATAALKAGQTADVRVSARLLLVDAAGQDLHGVGELLAEAGRDAVGDPRLEAQVACYAATLAYFERRYDDADAESHRAEKLARVAGDTDQIIRAIGMQATMALTMGRDDGDDLHAGAYQLAEGRPVTTATIEARQSWAMTALFRGDLRTAREEIRQLESDVRDLGLMRDLMSVLISCSAIYARSGYGAEALKTARECERLFTDAGASPAIGLTVAAGAEWCAGSAAAAISLARKAIAACEAIGDTEWLEVSCAILGQALLLSGDAPAAVMAFNRAASLEAAARSGDPAIIPWHADHVEALVHADELEAATAAFTEVRRRVSRFKRPVVRLGLERSCALHRAAGGDPAGAAEALRNAIATYGEISYPIDVARAYLILGQLERRARRRAAARVAFGEAIARFSAIGALAWLPCAQHELDKLNKGSGTLSETERQVVHLVRSGATNREIAASMYLSVKAVEAHLSRLYRRYNVRNRTDLLRILA
ncbi:transcriptional regulator [Catellatospora sp. IY07-71]|uniref:helix-turn-helix transcriptional regulator n=1 Tax=Catellatospora sp. IY07-71 TaxID=2728827 RepID=UPI001BB3B57A|nr:LuxR family transcriptional regulator [Catellatospora sp. IY07-71]BCJ78130.1 transcriptional regulator [Catellatospora sp. IY07-71]